MRKKEEDFVMQIIKTVEGRIVFRYTTYINSRTKLPAITNLAMYCIAQEPSIEISDYSGCHYNCVNNSDLPDVIDMTKIIESHLIEKWELIIYNCYSHLPSNQL
jgi:hypothetical protein